MALGTIFERLCALCGTEEIAEIARCTDLSYNTVKNYQQGRHPKSEFLLQIVNKLREKSGKTVNLNWLLMRDGPMYTEEYSEIYATEPGGDLAGGELELEIPAHSIRVQLKRRGSASQSASQFSPGDETHDRLPLLTMIDELKVADLSTRVKREASLRLLEILGEDPK